MEMTLEISRKLLNIPPNDLTRLVSHMTGMGRRNGGRVLPVHYDRACKWLMIDHWLDSMAREIGDGDLLPLLTSLRMALDEMRDSGQLDSYDPLTMMRGTLYPLLKRKSSKIIADLRIERNACTDPVRRKAIMAEVEEHYRTWIKMSEYWRIEP